MICMDQITLVVNLLLQAENLSQWLLCQRWAVSGCSNIYSIPHQSYAGQLILKFIGQILYVYCVCMCNIFVHPHSVLSHYKYIFYICNPLQATWNMKMYFFFNVAKFKSQILKIYIFLLCLATECSLYFWFIYYHFMVVSCSV